MIKGTVEVYKENNLHQHELVFVENNLVVDGLSESIADFMCLPPDASGAGVLSGLYDASNYAIHTISFGKAPQEYYLNAHSTTGITKIARESSGLLMQQYSTQSTSSYVPLKIKSSSPTPIDKVLASFEGVDRPTTVSSNFYAAEYYGQNPNLIPFNGTIIKYIDISGSSVAVSSTYLESLVDGCYPPASGIRLNLTNYAYTIYSPTTPTPLYVASGIVSGVFNTVSSMDFRGYVKRVNGTAVADASNGLIVSSTNTLSSTGEVIYVVRIASGDAAVANFYGGITQAGLWGFNISNNIDNSMYPPYSFKTHPMQTGTYSEPLTYRLFAKKVFADNIVKSLDYTTLAGITNHSPLLLIWRLKFI